MEHNAENLKLHFDRQRKTTQAASVISPVGKNWAFL